MVRTVRTEVAFRPGTALAAVALIVLPLFAWPRPAAAAGESAGAAGPASVDRLVSRLDQLTLSTLGGWKVSGDLAASGLDKAGNAPAAAAYDDAAWPALAFEQRLSVDTCWIRTKLVLPRFVSGEEVSGPVTLSLTVDDGGDLFVNGEPRGHFDWNGEFELTPGAKPGDTFVVAIRAINTGGPLRLMRAGLRFKSGDATRQAVDDLVMSLRVGQKLLSRDTHQSSARGRTDPGTDLSTDDPAEKARLTALLQDVAARVDVEALARGDGPRFEASLAKTRVDLAPVALYAQRFTLLFDANAHIDAAWLWREKETVQVCRNTFSSVLNMFDARPGFTYTQSAAAYYEWMQRLYPDLFKRMKERISEPGSRWETVGGMWVEPDCNLPSGESWARHLLYGKRFMRRELGRDVTVGWNPDSFGYNWNMPQFYRNAGIDAFITQKLGWNRVNVFPHRAFWWQAPDGSRVLAYFPFDYVYTVEDPFALADWLRQFEANTGMKKLLVLFGVGDHGGGPSLDMLDRVDRLRKLAVFPKIEYGTAGDYLGWMHEQDLSKLPVWTDELYLEYHEGTFTTQAKMKEQNRRSEVLLTNAEKFGTLATRAGRAYDGNDMESAWRDVLFNQFHDILPGSSIREVYVDAPKRYEHAHAIAGHELDGALRALAAGVDTADTRGTPLLVFNSLGWERRGGLVRVPLPAATPSGEAASSPVAAGGDAAGGSLTGDLGVFDADGRELPSQFVATGPYARDLLFIAPDVPALGYRLFELREKPPARTAAPKETPARGALSIDGRSVENQNLRVEIDPATGWIRSIFDKRARREVLSGPGNELQLLEDKPDAWDAWNIGLTGTEYPSTFRSAEIVERGPVRAVLRVTRDYLKPGVKKDFPTEDFPTSFFTQDIVLYDGAAQVDFRTTVDWWEQRTMLKVAFPVTVDAPAASYEIPFGSIERSTRMETSFEKAKVEVPAQRWADLSGGGYGASLLNTSKYGYDVKGHVLRLSLLRSPNWPDPTADRGMHVIDYALYPHAGGWREAGTVRRGAELNAPLIPLLADHHRGRKETAHSFIALAPPALVLSTVKKAEDSDDWIVQWYDTAGRDTVAEVTLPFEPQRVVMTNFLEEDGAPVAHDGARVRVPTGKNAIVTLKIRP